MGKRPKPLPPFDLCNIYYKYDPASGLIIRKIDTGNGQYKKGEIENVDSLLNKGVLQNFVKALVDAKNQLKAPSMKRKITMYKRKR